MTNVNLENREAKLTDAEFDALERNVDGRIIDDMPFAWIWMTDDQKLRVHSDDAAYGEDLDEEMRIMMAEELG